MRFRNTILLLVVLLGLGAYVWYVERPQAEKEAKKERLVDFKADEVSEIVLAGPDRELTLLRADGKWRLTKPIQAEADDVAVKSILSILETAEVKKGLDGETKDLALYGLDKPNTTIALKAGDKALPAVKIGDAAPIGGSAYALRGDEKKVLLTTATVRSGVDKSLKDLRDKSIFKFTDDSVRKIEVKSADQTLVLRKNAEQWKIESPVSYDADATVVRSYLSTLRALRATDFPDEKADPATYALNDPRLSVTLTLGDGGAQQTLLVGGGNDKKEVYAKTASSPTVYTVGEWVGRDLDKPAADFRDKSLVAFDKDAIKSIEVTRRDGSTYTLRRGDDGKWKLEGVEGNASPAALTAFVNDVAMLKGYEIAADNVEDLAAYGLAPATISMKITGADGKELGTLLLGGREVEGKRDYTGARAGGKTVFLMRDYHVTRVDKPGSDLLAKPTPAGGAAAPGREALPMGDMPPGMDDAGNGEGLEVDGEQ